MTNKKDFTKQVIIDFLYACGPVEFMDILSEVKTQAYAGYLASVMSELKNTGKIVYDIETESFDINYDAE